MSSAEIWVRQSDTAPHKEEIWLSTLLPRMPDHT
jgi:hypothetical protein